MSTHQGRVVYLTPVQYPAGNYFVMARSANQRKAQHGGTENRGDPRQQQSKQAERVMREAYKRERKIASYLAEDDNFPVFANQLAKHGLQLRDIPGDGNCLFRALGDQLEGHGRCHYQHRCDVATFMYQHRKDFEPFVEDNVPFESHISNLKKLGTYAGNDAIVAFARLKGVNIIIHQLSAPFLEIHGSSNPKVHQLHIAYHNGDHYSSVRRLQDNTESPTDIFLQIRESSDSQKGKKDGFMGGYHGNPGSGGGTARVIRDESAIEHQVMAATGCEDVETVRQSLCDSCYDIEMAIADVFQLMEISNREEAATLASQRTSCDSGIWSLNGTGSRVICSSVSSAHPNHQHSRENSVSSSGYGSLGSHGGARPKHQNVSARQKKELKKLDKKKRATERHKQQMGLPGIHSGNDVEGDNQTLVTIAANDTAIIRA